MPLLDRTRQPLLRTIKGRRVPSDAVTTTKERRSSMQTPVASPKREFQNPSPAHSPDAESSPAPVDDRLMQPIPDSSGSEAETRRAQRSRADINPTTFSHRPAPKTNGLDKRKRAVSTGMPSKRASRSQPSKQGSFQMPPSSGEPSEPSSSQNRAKSHKGSLTYGKNSKRMIQETRKKPAKFERPDTTSSPENSKGPSFRDPDEENPKRSSQTSGGGVKPKIKSKTLETRKANLSELEDTSDEELKAIVAKLKTTPKKSTAGFKKHVKSAVDRKLPDISFMVPVDSPLTKDSADFQLDHLAEPLSSSSLSDLDSEAEVALSSQTSCPWCGKEVDATLLKRFSKGERLKVRKQSEFCRLHRKDDARKEWQTKGYPMIRWDRMHDRLREHKDFLFRVINGDKSHFRSELAGNIRQGRSRTIREEDNFNPGYYGPRGLNVMCDYLVTEFGDLLKERAGEDRVIAGRGSAAFIQTVLVAELAVQLIKEDMSVGDDEARNILEESKALGEMLHEEEH